MTSKQIGELKAVIQMQTENAQAINEQIIKFAEKMRTFDRAMTLIDSLADRIREVERLLEEYQHSDWMTTEDVASMLKVDEQTVRRKYHAGELPGYQIDDRYHIRFERKELEAAIRSAGLKNEIQERESA